MIRGTENVCEPAVKYKFSKKLGCWVRTWFTIETENKEMFFKQRNAFSKSKDTAWDKWQSKPM